LNRSFWPDREATGQFLTELCDDLALDHQITFITGPACHPDCPPAPARHYRLWWQERRGPISIIRTRGTRLPKRRLPLRFINLGTYFLLAAAATLKLERPDLIVAATDPPLLGMLAVILKRRWNCRLVYNVRDLYPDIAYANGALRSRVLLKLLDHANRLAYASADRVITVGHDMRDRIIAKGVPPARVTVVPDWVDCTAIRPVADNPLRRSFGDKFVVMYAGNLGLSQQLETMIAAAQRLRGDPRILFVLIGEGARKRWLIERAAALNLPNLLFLPYQPRAKLAESLSAADLHVIPMAAGTGGCLVPSKVYGIMAAGCAFIAMMDERAEVAQLALRHDIGFLTPPGDDAALVNRLENVLQNLGKLNLMGTKARKIALTCFNREIVTRQFGEVLAAVTRSDLAAPTCI